MNLKILAASYKKGLLLAVFLFVGCVHRKVVVDDVLVKAENIRLRKESEEYLQAYLELSGEMDDLQHRVEKYLALKCRCKHKGVLQ